MRSHLFPFRTQKLSSHTPTILGWRRPGKIGSLRDPKEALIVRSTPLYHCFAKRNNTSLGLQWSPNITLALWAKTSLGRPAARLHSFILVCLTGTLSFACDVILRLCRRISEYKRLFRVKKTRSHKLRSEILHFVQDDKGVGTFRKYTRSEGEKTIIVDWLAHPA